VRDDARLRTAVASATARLADAGVPSPRVDAIALAEHALGVPQLILAVPPALPADFEARLDELVRRREAREPLQHIVGFAAFRRLSIRVGPGVFLPRPETEIVTQPAVDEARRLVADGREPLIVDLCSGSGVIGLSVVFEVPGSRVVGIDSDPTAVAVSQAAAVAAGSGAVRMEVGDVRDPGLLADVAGAVDVVISNPPYIPDDAVPLDPEVADHDPHGALFGGGADGLDLPRHVVAAAVRLLGPGGLFVMEHADVQGAAVRELLDRTGAFGPASTHQDLTGRDRFVTARRRSP